MRQHTIYYVALLSLLFLEENHAFVIPQVAQAPRTKSSSLQLLPGQGNQLVAASNAVYCKEEEKQIEAATAAIHSNDESIPVHSPTAAAKSFAHRVFSLPSSMIKRHPHPKWEGFAPKQLEKDVVYYPVVGFQFVHTDGGDIALPTTGHAACQLNTQTQTEDVVGWFSPSCKLDAFSEDPCHKPKE
jgi:hypothetical protein